MKAILFAWTAVLSLLLLCPTMAHAKKIKTGMVYSKYKSNVEFGLLALRAKDYSKAKELLEEMAKLGNKNAQFYLAQMYLNGWGVDKPDYYQGWLWFNVALEQKTSDWRFAEKKLKQALPQDFIDAMTPYVDDHIAQYGAKAQDMVCSKTKAIGSNTVNLMCRRRTY